jgi:hypothetical protein
MVKPHYKAAQSYSLGCRIKKFKKFSFFLISAIDDTIFKGTMVFLEWGYSGESASLFLLFFAVSEPSELFDKLTVKPN